MPTDHGRIDRHLAALVLSLALLVALSSDVGAARAQSDAEECPLASPAEVSEAFEGKISVEVEKGSSDGCTFDISGRSFSYVRLMQLSDGGNVVANNRKRVESGEIEGEVIDDLGEGAVLSMTNQALTIDLGDGSILTVSVSIYGETLRPVLEDDEKKWGLLTLGRLAVARVGK